MTIPRAASRLAAAACALGIAIAGLSACAPEPVPTPTPTASFASEEEAFAAAEEVYREYLVAMDGRTQGLPAADPTDYLTGTALEADADAQQALAENGLRVEGASTLQSFAPVSSDLSGPVGDIVAEICLDISESRVIDSEGADVTPADRPEHAMATVTFVGNAEAIYIAETTSDGEAAC